MERGFLYPTIVWMTYSHHISQLYCQPHQRKPSLHVQEVFINLEEVKSAQSVEFGKVPAYYDYPE